VEGDHSSPYETPASEKGQIFFSEKSLAEGRLLFRRVAGKSRRKERGIAEKPGKVCSRIEEGGRIALRSDRGRKEKKGFIKRIAAGAL